MIESTVLEVNKLSKRYGKQMALENFDSKVQKGEIVGILDRTALVRHPIPNYYWNDPSV